MRLKKLLELTGGRIIGDPDIEISGVSGIREAQRGDVTFISPGTKIPPVSDISASAVIAKKEIDGLSASMLIVDNPRLTFAKVLGIFQRKPHVAPGVSGEAILCKRVSLGEGVTIFPHAYVSESVVIGARVSIFPHVYLGEGVIIGDDSIVYPNVTIREGVRIGRRVIIHSGTVIGSDGFGYVSSEDGSHYKIPQIGGVVIDDDVEIGSNVSIDRATTGNTVIGCGTKIDNLVQIGHNVTIGSHCIIVAQTGIGGSVEIGNGAVIGGQTGLRDHVTIGNGVMIGAGSGVARDIPDGQVFTGSPAIPHKKWLRAQSIYAKLPEYIQRIHRLEKRADREGSSHD
jgi:UDP-3-O-[3-hydroxymyristoyl] glucosamine N-acyltransferase